MYKCKLCKRDTKGYNGFVWFSGDNKTDLCKSCMMKWNRSKERKVIDDKYKKAKPCTKLWYKRCDEFQRGFNLWFKLKRKELSKIGDNSEVEK